MLFFLKNWLLNKVFPSLSVCHALLPILLWRMLGTSCHLLRLWREFLGLHTLPATKQMRKDSFTSQHHSRRQGPEDKLHHVETGWNYSHSGPPKPRVDPAEMCQIWSPLLLRVTQSYLGELVLLYCLQFLVFSLWVPVGWSTFPPTDMVYCLLGDWGLCHRNRRSPFLSHPLTCEWQ